MTPRANLTASRYEWVQSVLPPLLTAAPSDLVLDIGAGDGCMGATIASSGARRAAYDLIPQSEDITHWNLDNPPSSQWEQGGIALLLDVIEHCNNPWLAMTNLSKLLHPKAYLLLTAPNPKWSRGRLHLLSNGFQSCFTQSDLDLNHHVFTPWPHIIEALLNDTGFTIHQYVTLDGPWPVPPLSFSMNYLPRLAVAATCRTIERIDRSAVGMSYGIIASKKAIPA